MSVYTRTGDDGWTSLFSGERVSKADARVDAYGDLDELCSLLGVVSAALPEGADELRQELATVQGELMRLGTQLATARTSRRAGAVETITAADVARLERAIDGMEADLDPLRSFLLPGGHASAAAAHLARAVCRRVERKVAGLDALAGGAPPGATEALVYLNRLSDHLFVLARTCNRVAGSSDTPWDPGAVRSGR